MAKYLKAQINMPSEDLYEQIRQSIRQARSAQGLSQAALGKKVGMVQRHISEIESGKVMPRLDTVLEILRVLNMDLVLTSKPLLPLVKALIENKGAIHRKKALSEQPLYAVDEDEESDDVF